MSTHASLIKRILQVLGAVSGLGLAVVYVALATEYGARRLTAFGLSRIDPESGLTVSYESLRGSLLGGVGFSGVHIRHADFTVTVDNLEIGVELAGLLDNRVELSRLDLEGPRINILAGETDPVPDIEYVPLPVSLHGRRVVMHNLRLFLGGGEYTVGRLEMEAGLIDRTLSFSALDLAAEGVRIGGGLTATLDGALPLEAELDYELRRPLPLDYERAAGSLHATGDLSILELRNNLTDPLVISSEGTIETLFGGEDMRFEFLHRADSLRIPIQAAAHLSAADVVLGTTGNSGDLGLTLSGSVIGELVPGVPRLAVDGSGTLRGEALSMHNVSISHDSGEVTGSGKIDWSMGVVVDAGFELQERNPRPLIPAELPLVVSALAATGAVHWADTGDSQGPRLNLMIDAVQARLGDYDMQGRGRLTHEEGVWEIEDLNLLTEDNRVALNGRIGDTLSLAWDIDVPRLEQFLTGFRGHIEGSGTAAGSPDNPVINGSLIARELAGRGMSANGLALRFDGEGGGYSGDLTVDGITLPGERQDLVVTRGSAAWRGGRADHDVTYEIQSNRGRLSGSLSGGFTGPAFDAWQGSLISSNIESELGNWTLESPVPLNAAPGRIGLSRGCWSQQEARLCLAADSAGATVRVNAGLAGFPLAEFNGGNEPHWITLAGFPRLPPGVNLSGHAGLEGEVTLSPREEPRLNFTATAAAAALAISPAVAAEGTAVAGESGDGNRRLYRWSLFEVEGVWRDGAWVLDGVAELAAERTDDADPPLNGVLTGRLELSARNELGGSLSASFPDLGWVQAAVPQLSRVRGSLDSELVFAGNLDAPVITGEFELADASFFSNRFGVAFTDLDAVLAADNLGAARLEGSVRSGEGAMDFSGTVDGLFSPDPEIRAAVQGRDFRFVDLPGLQVEISPQLDIAASAQNIDFSGRLEVSRLQLTLRNLPETAVDVSRDVVIVSYSEDRPDLALPVYAGQSRLFDIPVTGNIILELGENVGFNGFGLSASLGGELEVQQSANGSNLTYGEVDIRNGSYQMYGQTLRIRQGTVLFLGALDNPALDIRAVREVGDQTVGVLINGTLRSRRSQLFSSPVLPENDILAILITGSPYSQLDEDGGSALINAVAGLGLERGQGFTGQIRDRLGLDNLDFRNSGNLDSTELTVGKYLTPGIFVQYGVGLFDNEAKVSVDYYFSDRIKLQAESGEYQSVDITYTVER